MTWQLEFDSIAGISDGEAEINRGLNVIRASNWQGKSSFLKALETALGVSTPLMQGATEGYVTYESPDFAGTVALRRTDADIKQTGSPILCDRYDIVRTELFACLGEDNEVREAVRAGANLEEIMLRPLDFENIDERISELTYERDQIDTEIERAEKAQQQLPALEQRVTELQNDLSELREKQDDLAANSGTNDEETESSARSTLAEVESKRNRIKNRIEQLERSIERTEKTIAEKESELEELEIPEDAELQSSLREAQNRLQDLKRDKRVLESVHSATEMVLTEDRLELITEVDRELTGDSFTCWTCGSETSPETVEGRLTQLREKITSIQAEADSQQTKVEKLEAKRETVSQNRKRKEALESDLAQLRNKLSEDRQSLASAQDRLEELNDKVEQLSEQVTEQIDELTDVESEIKYREAELDDVKSDREELQQRAEQLEMLEAERADISSELEELRSRKSKIRQDTREAFDAAIDDILTEFETGFETARLTSNFELVVARDGQEATLDALSEGEIELLGFVAALAGYEAFNVEEISPFLLVDQVGGLAEHNLHTLVEYLQPRTEYIVFTAYPGYNSPDASIIDPGEWAVGSAD